MNPPPGLFITATDTGVGKTFLSSAIVRAMRGRGDRVGALKPVASSATLQGDGDLASDDTLRLRDALGGAIPLDRITPLVFEGDLAPCVAARNGGVVLTHGEILEKTREAIDWWSPRCDVLVVEGVGGLLCPLAEDSTLIDLAIALDYPLVIVARRGLGTLNHVLLTVEVARRRGLRFAGIVLNGSEPTLNFEAEQTNPFELSRRLGPVAILGDIPHGIDESAMSETMRVVDWKELALPPRIAVAVPG